MTNEQFLEALPEEAQQEVTQQLDDLMMLWEQSLSESIDAYDRAQEGSDDARDNSGPVQSS